MVAGLTPPSALPRLIPVFSHLMLDCWTLLRVKDSPEKVLPCLTMTMVLSVHDINGALTTFALPKRLRREKACVLKPPQSVVLRESDTFVAHPTQTLFCLDVSSFSSLLSTFPLPSYVNLLFQREGGERIRMSDDNQEWARESAVIYGKVQPAQLNEMRLMWMAKHHTREAFHKHRHHRLRRLLLLICFTAVLEGNSSAVLVPEGAGDFPPPCNHSK